MSVLDLPGKHCDKKDCNQLDFLPFTCDKCSKVFCLAHKGYSDHDCSFDITQVSVMPQCPMCTQYVKVLTGQAADVVVNRHINSGCTSDLLEKSHTEKKQAKKKKHCGACRNPENFDTVICTVCRQQFCLTHRHSDSHKCAPVNPGTRKTGGGSTASRLLGMFGVGSSKAPAKPSASAKAPSAKPSAKTAQSAAAVNKLRMKMKAIGNPSVKEENRIYFEVSFPRTDIFGKPMSKPACNMWFDKKWTIGRVIDDICDRCSLENRNNEKNAKKVNLFRAQAQFPHDVPLELLAPELSSGDSISISYV